MSKRIAIAAIGTMGDIQPFVALALASSLAKLLGRSGIEVITRVFGLILTSIAVTNIIIAIKLSFGLATAA